MTIEKVIEEIKKIGGKSPEDFPTSLVWKLYSGEINYDFKEFEKFLRNKITRSEKEIVKLIEYQRRNFSKLEKDLKSETKRKEFRKKIDEWVEYFKIFEVLKLYESAFSLDNFPCCESCRKLINPSVSLISEIAYGKPYCGKCERKLGYSWKKINLSEIIKKATKNLKSLKDY